MKHLATIASSILLLLAIAAAPLAAQGASPAAAQPSDADASYALGMLMGNNLKGVGLTIGVDDFMAGFRAVMAGTPPKFTSDQAETILRSALQAAQAKKAADNLAAGRSFLEANRQKTGVKVTATGLQYEVLSPGSGPKPAAADKRSP